MPVTQIDLTDIPNKYKRKLFDYFSESTIKTWLPGYAYMFDDGEKFTFSHLVIKRRRKKGKRGHRFELLDDTQDTELGSGGFSDVHLLDGRIHLSEKSVEYKAYNELNYKQRIVKITNIHKQFTVLDARRERYLSSRAGHLRVKHLVRSTNNQFYFMVMRKLPGKPLDNILDEGNLSDSIKLKLTIMLIKSVKTQVYDKKIIHRDLKPENILVDLSTYPITVNIIDFGLSILNHKNPRSWFAGTLEYMAPELFYRTSEPNKKIDVFSLGLVIAKLWGLEISQVNWPSDPKLREKAIIDAFYGAQKLSLSVETMKFDKAYLGIKTLLKNMLSINTDERINIPEAVSMVDDIYRKIKKYQNKQSKLSINIESNKLSSPTKKVGFFDEDKAEKKEKVVHYSDSTSLSNSL